MREKIYYYLKNIYYYSLSRYYTIRSHFVLNKIKDDPCELTQKEHRAALHFYIQASICEEKRWEE